MEKVVGIVEKCVVLGYEDGGKVQRIKLKTNIGKVSGKLRMKPALEEGDLVLVCCAEVLHDSENNHRLARVRYHKKLKVGSVA